MTEVRFKTSEADRLDVAVRAEQPGVAECVVAIFDTWRGSMSFRLERLEGNRWAIWKERENNNFDGEYEAKSVEQSRERILLDDAALLNERTISEDAKEQPTVHCPKCNLPAPVTVDQESRTIVYQCCNVVAPYPPYLSVGFTRMYGSRDNYHVQFRSPEGFGGYMSLFIEQGRDVRPIVTKMLGMELTDFIGK